MCSRTSTRWWRRFWAGLSLVSLALVGCTFTTRTYNIGQKTSLELQLMGEVEPLSEEEILLSSVRAQTGGLSAGSLDAAQLGAIAARRRQLFNRDDVDELKQDGCLGEGLRAVLVARSCERATAGEVATLRDRVLAEENADRQAIIDWALANDPLLTAVDRPQIEALYGRALREKARAGEWVQGDNGAWSRR